VSCSLAFKAGFVSLIDEINNDVTRRTLEEIYFNVEKPAMGEFKNPLIMNKRKIESEEEVESKVIKKEKNILDRLGKEGGGNAVEKPCFNHLAGLFKVKDEKGVPYSCGKGKACTFKHVILSNLPKNKVKDMVSKISLPTMKRDIFAAMKEPAFILSFKNATA
jgi:hypothetical protein